jgi:hypothetical protein
MVKVRGFLTSPSTETDQGWVMKLRALSAGSDLPVPNS